MNKIVKRRSFEIVSTINAASGGLPAADSIFHRITIACLRCKQLNRGANPRLKAQNPKWKNTTIAIEEIRQGLVNYSAKDE